MDPHLLLRDSEPRIHPTAELKSCRLGRYVTIAERVILREVVVGDFSYFERHAEAAYATIGKFCSIAPNTRINALEHPLERVTTHKVSYRPNEYFRGLGGGKFAELRAAVADPATRPMNALRDAMRILPCIWTPGGARRRIRPAPVGDVQESRN